MIDISPEVKTNFENDLVNVYLANAYPDLSPSVISYMVATMEVEARFMRKWRSDKPLTPEIRKTIPFQEYLYSLPDGCRPPRGKCRSM
jgi:hypothetical protein